MVAGGAPRNHGIAYRPCRMVLGYAKNTLFILHAMGVACNAPCTLESDGVSFNNVKITTHSGFACKPRKINGGSLNVNAPMSDIQSGITAKLVIRGTSAGGIVGARICTTTVKKHLLAFRPRIHYTLTNTPRSGDEGTILLILSFNVVAAPINLASASCSLFSFS